MISFHSRSIRSATGGNLRSHRDHTENPGAIVERKSEPTANARSTPAKLSARARPFENTKKPR